VWGAKTVPGGFDSHALPQCVDLMLYILQIFVNKLKGD